MLTLKEAPFSTRNVGKNLSGSSLAALASVVGVALAATPVRAQAQTPRTLLGFSFSSSTTADTVDMAVAPSSATLDISRLTPPVTNNGNFIRNDGFGNALAAQPYSGATNDNAPPDPNSTLTVQSYFAFTLTAAQDNDLNLSALQFDVIKGGTSDPRGYDVRSSLDGYATPIVANQLPTGAPSGFQTITTNLSGNAGLQHINAVTFRFYVYAPDAQRSIDFRNLFITGTSDVLPEPGALALVLPGIAVLGVGVSRRRRPAQ